MTIEIDQVEAVLRKHWTIPSDLSRGALQDYAGRVYVLIRQKYAHDNLKYQLGLIQKNKLGQEINDKACDQIATDLLQAAKA